MLSEIDFIHCYKMIHRIHGVLVMPDEIPRGRRALALRLPVGEEVENLLRVGGLGEDCEVVAKHF